MLRIQQQMAWILQDETEFHDVPHTSTHFNYVEFLNIKFYQYLAPSNLLKPWGWTRPALLPGAMSEAKQRQSFIFCISGWAAICLTVRGREQESCRDIFNTLHGNMEARLKSLSSWVAYSYLQFIDIYCICTFETSTKSFWKASARLVATYMCSCCIFFWCNNMYESVRVYLPCPGRPLCSPHSKIGCRSSKAARQWVIL